MIKFLLLSALVALSNSVSCNSDGSCPWWCVTCSCCAGTCYFGTDLSGCDGFTCEGCQAAAAAGMAVGSVVACNAAADAACIGAGGGPEDFIADSVCPVIVAKICGDIFNHENPVTPLDACKDVGFCHDGDTPWPSMLELGAPRLGNSTGSGSGTVQGSGAGMFDDVLMDKNGKMPLTVVRFGNETDDIMTLSFSAGYDSMEQCTNHTLSQGVPVDVGEQGGFSGKFALALGCNEVGAVSHDGSFIPSGYSVSMQCKGDGTDTIIRNFYVSTGNCTGEAEFTSEVANGACAEVEENIEVSKWSNYNCASGESILATNPPTSAPTSPEELRPHCEHLDQRYCRRFKTCQWVRMQDGSKACVAKESWTDLCAGEKTKNGCRARGCIWNRKQIGQTRCTPKPATCGDLTSSKQCKRSGCKWSKRKQECK